MPKIASSVDAQLKDLTSRLERLVETAMREGREDALSQLRGVLGGGGTGGRKTKRASSKPAKKTRRRKSTKPRRNWWATATEAQKKARVKKMLAGRGLKPKRKREPS